MSLGEALRDARGAGLCVRIADLGAWPLRPILAEYDPADRSIAVNARIVAALRREHGVAFARRFVTFAILHELHHHQNGSRDEKAAHSSARRHCGDRAMSFETAVRALAMR
jgi:hypothetical protein